MRVAFPLVLAAILAAGCVVPSTQLDALSGKTANELLPTLEIDDSHDHKNVSQHLASWNVELLGYDPVAPDTTQLGRYNHVNVQGTRAYVSAYHLANGTAPGLAVFNISADDPVLVGTLETPDLTTIDVHGTPDGRYVVLAGHRDNRAQPPALPEQVPACSGTPMVNVCMPFVPYGVILVDVSDEANPTVAATWTSPPSGAHTAKVVPYDDGYYVFIASYGFSYLNRVASHVEILKVEDSPLGTQLRPVAEFAASKPSGNDGTTSTFVHDMYVEEHPVTNQTLMYVAYWDGGVVIADVSDPSRPAQVASWADFDPALYGNVHFARPIGMIGEQHISVAAPEFGSAEHAGEMYVLDTTDPTAPQLLSKWTLPGDPVNDGGYRFSPHNFDPMGTRMVYAHYHGGVWVLDLADPMEPEVQAYVFPTVPEGNPAFEAKEDAPNVWAAVWASDGTIYASDIGTGLYHYGMLSDAPGVAPYEAALVE